MKTAQITVEYLDHLGTDMTVVNAARTSFGKESIWDYEWYQKPSREDPNVMVPGQRAVLKKADASLIRFLATGFRTQEWDKLLDGVRASVHAEDKEALADILLHYKKSAQHWTPFSHPHMQIRMKLPIFLARQFVKHQVGGAWSEESRRYMSSEPEFWFPQEWHGRPEDIKQGSDGLHPYQQRITDAAMASTASSLHSYNELLSAGIAPEEARIVLPLNTMTTVTWTGSLLFWSRVCNQRLDSHAQKAANELASKISAFAQPLFPVSWAALVG